MKLEEYEYQSSFARRYLSEGKAEGKAGGRAESVVVVLESREFHVGADLRAQIVLVRWIGAHPVWGSTSKVASSSSACSRTRQR